MSTDKQELSRERPPADLSEDPATQRSDQEKRSRSRSPRQQHREQRPKRKDAGFKWKEKRKDEDDREERDQGLKRGYRDQYKSRGRSRSRSRSPRRRESERYDSRYQRIRGRESKPTDRDRYDDQDSQNPPRKDEKHRDDKREKPEKEKKKPAPPIPSTPQQEMILVTVNDRLGTKRQIPCLPTDTIKDFKAVVAMMIGRRPHEILLKRQSERPFKDFLTLRDYGISNNVQLDLEVDTGD